MILEMIYNIHELESFVQDMESLMKATEWHLRDKLGSGEMKTGHSAQGVDEYDDDHHHIMSPSKKN